MKEQKVDLEQLVTKAMHKSYLETPSFQFTDRVMAAINAKQQTVVSCYRPLIPKYIWVAIAIGIVGITAYLWYLLQPVPLDLPTLSFDFMENNPLSKEVAALTVSKITTYALLFLALMVFVQIPMLKRYFNKHEVYEN